MMDEGNRYVHDAYIATFERHLKRQWIAILLLIVLLFGSNAAWLYYESQFTSEMTTTVTQELTADGGDAVINDGVHIYDEGKTDSNKD